MDKRNLFFLSGLVILALGACKRQPAPTDYPRAEWDRARVILMHTPGQELFNGALHPTAALFEEYLDVDKAAREHRGYIQLLERNGIRVYTVSEILNEVGIDSLRIIGEGYLEGGDYLPAGKVSFIGCGMRTNDEGNRQMMEADAFGYGAAHCMTQVLRREVSKTD